MQVAGLVGLEALELAAGHADHESKAPHGARAERLRSALMNSRNDQQII
jgi:hypothetical protein